MKLPTNPFTPSELERITLSMDADKTTSILVAIHRPRLGNPRLAAFWKSEDEQDVLELLGTRVAMYWFKKASNCDLSQVRIYGFQLSASGRTSQFQAVGAHGNEGNLHPIIMAPIRFLLLRDAAFALLFKSLPLGRDDEQV
jgi:hypothetical protein